LPTPSSTVSTSDFNLIENLTKEQFSGEYRNKLANINASRDSLNPAINLETLKNRLWVTEHYRLLHGVEHAYWPHYALRNVGLHLNKYKFNYLVKAFFVYQCYRDVQHYRYRNSVSFMKSDEQAAQLAQIAWTGFLTGAAFLLI
jgi:hypothetical protein